ncbi:MAG: DUF3524 domain-containing protein [Balneola sp.]|nr:MAG: DUF3524 domain-containing protein [Balneola sp.]
MGRNILLLEPFFSGSHRQWCEGFKKYSSHSVDILSLPGRHWKWRMHGGAVSLAEQFNQLEEMPDSIIASSMLDLTTFLALTRKKSVGIPVSIYFHENQLTYPWSPQDRDVKNRRDNHYAFINYASAIAADKIFFNSKYHKDSFLNALPAFLNQFPDKRDKNNIQHIEAKSEVLSLGLDLSRLDEYRVEAKNSVPVILWNHRWEYDKNPEEFFNGLLEIKEKGIAFKLAVLGEQNDVIPPIFNQAEEWFKEEILHWGFTKESGEYASWLWRADILPVTSIQDFFGGSVVEAMYCNCIPLLPDRLAYPEHLSEDLKGTLLYEAGNFSSALEHMLINWDQLRSINTQELVQGYNWKTCIDVYDEKLS